MSKCKMLFRPKSRASESGNHVRSRFPKIDPSLCVSSCLLSRQSIQHLNVDGEVWDFLVYLMPLLALRREVKITSTTSTCSPQVKRTAALNYDLCQY